MFSKATNISLLNPVTKLNKCSDIKISLVFCPEIYWVGGGCCVLTLSSFCLLSSSIPALAVQKIGTTTFSKLILSSLAFFLTLQKKIQKYLVSMMHQNHKMNFNIYSYIYSVLFSWWFGKKSMPVAVHRHVILHYFH